MTGKLLRRLAILAALLPLSGHATTVEFPSAGSSYPMTGATDFVFSAGTYSVSISGLESYRSLSSLKFPYGNNVSVINYDGADGQIVLQWALNGNLISVYITGISPTTDAAIYSEASFKSAFYNPGVITYTSPPPAYTPPDSPPPPTRRLRLRLPPNRRPRLPLHRFRPTRPRWSFPAPIQEQP